MDVLISGSGIGGLTCAIALRSQGHNVKIFEQSKLNQETGAAIFLPPNVNGLLREFGFVPENYGANFCLGWRQYTALGEVEVDDTFSSDEYTSPWQMVHRQKLHEGLKHLAEDPRRSGPPVTIITSARVSSVDADTATVTLDDGNRIKGDVVIGADGIRSTTRISITGSKQKLEPYSAGDNCFRFLIPRETLLNDGRLSSVFQARDTLSVWAGEDRKLVCYPCDNNLSMNFVAIHPAELSSASSENGWHQQGSKQVLSSIYSEFCPEVRDILDHADPNRIRLYPLLDMDLMGSWVHKRVALLGDAAHPFLPHMGQGGAQAIEDALSLGIMLSNNVKNSDVVERLVLYERARKDRADRIQTATRICGSKRSEMAQIEFDFVAEREYQFRYNEIEHSRRLLASHVRVA